DAEQDEAECHAMRIQHPARGGVTHGTRAGTEIPPRGRERPGEGTDDQHRRHEPPRLLAVERAATESFERLLDERVMRVLGMARGGECEPSAGQPRDHEPAWPPREPPEWIT